MKHNQSLQHQAGFLTQQALDTNQHLPLASAPSWTWNLGRPISDTDWFSRYISTQRWSLKHWFFRLLTNWHGWYPRIFYYTKSPWKLQIIHIEGSPRGDIYKTVFLWIVLYDF
jgi:hypothetical protein